MAGKKDTDKPYADLGKIIDSQAIQELMNLFYKVTNIGMSIIDLKGNILVATGWQDICTKFHRVNPETCQHCMDSDTFISRNVEEGKYILYKCKNNMWDMASPIKVGGVHIANIFLGQFFFEDELVDYELFNKQAELYGFDKKEYIDALHQVPRLSREKVNNVMEFYSKFAVMIAKISSSNIRLEEKVDERTFELGLANEELEQEIAERKRADESMKARLLLSEYANIHTLDEVLQAALDEAERITRSRIGFFHFVDQDQITLSLQNWSTATLLQCTASGKRDHYPVSQAGVWVDCIRERRAIIHNDYASLPHRHGLPEGHVPVVRELVVPIFQGEKIVAVIGVGNKQTDYFPEDINCVTQLANLAWDIIQRKRAEAEREQFYQFFQTSSDLMLIRDPNGNFTKTNPACTETLGYSEAELTAKPFIEFVHPEDKQATLDEMARQLQRGFSMNFENRYICKDGSVRWLSWRAIFNKDKGIIYATARDITKSRRDEDALRESKEKINQILNSTAEGIYGIDLLGNCVFCNPACIRILGYHDENDLIGKNMHDLIHHTKADGTPHTKEECTILKAFQKGEYVHSDKGLFWRADGKGFPVEYWTYPILKDDRVTGAVVSIIDITDRVTLENQLRQSQKMEAVGQLAGGMAHDFNNILTAIMGYGSFALMNMAKDDPQRINIEHMLEGAERAAHLTNDLLLFSRKQISERKYVDLNEIIKKAKKFLCRIIGEDILFKTILHPGAIPVLADAHQLEQVMMNLATNARDAMPEGGVFNVTTEQIRLDKEFITTHGYGQQGMYALITVSDTGKGMDEATRQRIFDPFFTTKEMGRGTGLGMAVVYGIIEGHDGYIHVYSEPELGTTFKIYLPLTTIEREVTTESIQPFALGKGETILVAEDEPVVREVLRLSLEENGYIVIEAENGEDAVKQYKDNMEEVSLVLLDVIMPVKNGREAFNEIKRLKSDTKVIFMSGYTSDIITEKGMFETDAELIPKPISPDSLLRKVREVLDR